jgi:hypothetical protein
MTAHQARILTVLEYYCKGRGNAKTAKNLSRITGFGERQVRLIIAELRHDYHPIASAVHEPYGFYMPNTAIEARECLNHIDSRIKELYETKLGIERGLVVEFGNEMGMQNGRI